ncbi:MAG: hypothetical protein E6J29_01340 [Chloroflexi bacterium]|nr:MAG: hypothetical protein E6J29_01340 [Chloroflexota bacterium]
MGLALSFGRRRLAGGHVDRRRAAARPPGRRRGGGKRQLAGVLSLAPAAQVVSRVNAVNGALRALGCSWPNSLLSIETLTTGVIPHLRLWAEGYVRLRDGAQLGLNWS